jgi:methyltransferase family protein
VDVGGMWSVHGRTAFLAEEAGAERVVLLDVMPPTDEFKEERARRESAVEYVTGDLHDTEAMARLGEFDVVWCTGVLYHTPNPLLQVENLARLAGTTLVLGTRVLPEFPGIEQACVFYPMQSGAAQAEWARAFGDDLPRFGATTPFRRDLTYENWWWGMSPSAVRAMLDLAGFRVVEEHAPTPLIADFVAHRHERPAS